MRVRSFAQNSVRTGKSRPEESPDSRLQRSSRSDRAKGARCFVDAALSKVARSPRRLLNAFRRTAYATRAFPCSNQAANIAGALGFHQNRVVGFPRPTRKKARGLPP